LDAAYDPGDLAGDLDARLSAAAERVGHAARVLLRAAAAQHGLSIIQAQLLMQVAAAPAQSSITTLTARFDVRQPTVSDAVTSLQRKGLLAKTRQGRLQRLTVTEAGSQTVTDLAGWDAPLRSALQQQSQADRGTALELLLRVIAQLQASGVISVARSCTSCRFFRPNSYTDATQPHHCALLRLPLRQVDLRLDCPEHQPLPA
jgi:DNA-binding MarR family transcriptional regulator